MIRKTKIDMNGAIKRVEELLPLVNDKTPLDDPHNIELELLSNIDANIVLGI